MRARDEGQAAVLDRERRELGRSAAVQHTLAPTTRREIMHPSQAEFVSTPIALGSQKVDGAQIWVDARARSARTARTSFIT